MKVNTPVEWLARRATTAVSSLGMARISSSTTHRFLIAS